MLMSYKFNFPKEYAVPGAEPRRAEPYILLISGNSSFFIVEIIKNNALTSCI